MNAAAPLRPVLRSLATAWKPEPDGPRWAPWAWTAALNTLIAAALTLLLPQTGGFGANLLVSQAIGLTIHALFAAIGYGLRFDMFTLPPGLRAGYVLSVVLAGSWLGYAGAAWLRLGEWSAFAEHMTQASRFLLAIPVAWAMITMLLFAAVNRLRGRQLARERERGERVRAEREAIAARLQLLNAQIEPHFLYNTLAGIGARIPVDPEGAQALLDDLIGYLRASSRNMSQPMVALAEELESVQGYLAVMQRRLGGRLRVRCRVPPEAAAIRLPPAALQTLVENAIKHGIEPAPGGGEIAIDLHRREGGWALEVADTGMGLRSAHGAAGGPAGLGRGAFAPTGAGGDGAFAPTGPGGGEAGAPAALDGGGTGLANLAERLRLAVGPAAALSLEARPGGGAVARILLPDPSPCPPR